MIYNFKFIYLFFLIVFVSSIFSSCLDVLCGSFPLSNHSSCVVGCKLSFGFVQ